MTTSQAHERITTLEGRVRDIEIGHGETIYKMHRRLAKLELRLETVFTRFRVPDVSDADIDELLDRE